MQLQAQFAAKLATKPRTLAGEIWKIRRTQLAKGEISDGMMVAQMRALDFCGINDMILKNLADGNIRYHSIKKLVRKNGHEKSWGLDLESAKTSRAWQSLKEIKDDRRYKKLALLGGHPLLGKIKGRTKLLKILCGDTKLSLNAIETRIRSMKNPKVRTEKLKTLKQALGLGRSPKEGEFKQRCVERLLLERNPAKKIEPRRLEALIILTMLRS